MLAVPYNMPYTPRPGRTVLCAVAIRLCSVPKVSKNAQNEVQGDLSTCFNFHLRINYVI